MNSIQKIMVVSVVGILLMKVSPTHAMNLLFKPYDTLVRPEFYPQKKCELAAWAEGGVKPAQGFGSDGQTNVLQLYSPTQDALAMLEGFPANSPAGQLLTFLNATDDGVRGNFSVTGDLQLSLGAVLQGRWQVFPDYWIVSYIPFYSMRLSSVQWNDLTQSVTPADLRVQQYLTDDIAGNVYRLGDGLQLSGWHRHGPGDLNIIGEWIKSYPQTRRPLLKEATLNARVGVVAPTGVTTNPDYAFSLPFGTDGAWGLVFGGGLWVTLSDWFNVGFDVQLSHTFGATRIRRIKTSADQTELLLLATVPAYKDYGLIQRFNLFVEAYHFYEGCSATIGYQMLKKGEDSLALETCAYSSAIANTAASLDDWTAHSIEANLHYDLNVHLSNEVWWPQASLFVRWPFNGKRAILFTTVGAYVGVDF